MVGFFEAGNRGSGEAGKRGSGEAGKRGRRIFTMRKREVVNGGVLERLLFPPKKAALGNAPRNTEVNTHSPKKCKY